MAKLEILSGDGFDKSYIKAMISDHKTDIKEFQKEASDGKDPESESLCHGDVTDPINAPAKNLSIAAAAGIRNEHLGTATPWQGPLCLDRNARTMLAAGRP